MKLCKSNDEQLVPVYLLVISFILTGNLKRGMKNSDNGGKEKNGRW